MGEGSVYLIVSLAGGFDDLVVGVDIEIIPVITAPANEHVATQAAEQPIVTVVAGEDIGAGISANISVLRGRRTVRHCCRYSEIVFVRVKDERPQIIIERSHDLSIRRGKVHR